MKTINEAANDYSILKNGKPRDNQFFEITENGLDYQVNKKQFRVWSEVHKPRIVE